MKLIYHWRAQLNALWSIKLAVWSALLAVADQILSVFQSTLPPVVYSLMFVAIIIARVIDQPKLHGNATADDAKE